MIGVMGKKMIRKIQFFIISLIFTWFCVADENLGPADITVERIVKCENDDDLPHAMPIQMNKVNRSHAGYTGCIELPDDMDNTTAINLTMAKWGDGGWKPNALNFFQIDMCNVMKKNVEGPWDSLMKAAGRDDGSCPIEKGKYCVEKYTVDLEGVFPSMLYGKFRTDVTLLYNNQSYLCIRAFINSDPSRGGGARPPSGPPKG